VPAPATERGRKTRAEILAAAIAVFGEKGFERASISEITQRAGVAQGTFYVYFPDKLTLFVELVDDLGARLRRRIAAAVSGLDHRIDIERRGIRTFFDFARENRHMYRVVRQAEFVDEAAFRRYYLELAEGYTRGLAHAIEHEQIRPGDPEVLAYMLMGLTDFLGMRWVIWEQHPDLDRLTEEALAFIGPGLTTSPKSKRAATHKKGKRS
jgi:AcrR family transcriptional regulator